MFPGEHSASPKQGVRMLFQPADSAERQRVFHVEHSEIYPQDMRTMFRTPGDTAERQTMFHVEHSGDPSCAPESTAFRVVLPAAACPPLFAGAFRPLLQADVAGCCSALLLLGHLSCGLKARVVKAWGNAPGYEPSYVMRAEGPRYRASRTPPHSQCAKQKEAPKRLLLPSNDQA